VGVGAGKKVTRVLARPDFDMKEDERIIMPRVKLVLGRWTAKGIIKKRVSRGISPGLTSA